MENILFIMGALLFLALGALIVYWIFNLESEKYICHSIGCEYIMAILVLLYHIKGSSVFGKLPQHWVVFCVSIVFMLFVILYILLYVLTEKFEKKLLFLIPLFALEIWQIVTVWSNVKKNITIIDLRNVMIWFLVIFVVFETYYLFSYRKRNLKRESELIKRIYIRSNSALPFDFYIRNTNISGNVSDNISNLVIKLYQYARANRLSPSRLYEFLSHYEEFLPRDVKEKVIERFMESHYLNRMDSVNLIEFATILFPEFFGSPNKAYSSDRYNARLFEDFYVLSQKNLDRNLAQLNELNLKMSKIEEILSGTVETYINDTKNERPMETIESEQSIVREIVHLAKTPLLTTKIAAKNLLSDSENELSEKQKEKLETIMDNVSTVKLILEAYRKLVMVSNVSTNEDIVSYIKTAIMAMCDVCKKQINYDICNFPEKISVHGNNVMIILLMPLIHNAIEASPDNEKLIIKCDEKEDNYTIVVENACKILPKQKDLNMDGFSSKENGGEGLRSVRRISKSIGIKFRIKVYNKNSKVVATLVVPKK